jgi:hypothetical protein
MEQVRALHGEWHIPLEVLVKPYELRKKDRQVSGSRNGAV